MSEAKALNRWNGWMKERNDVMLVLHIMVA